MTVLNKLLCKERNCLFAELKKKNLKRTQRVWGSLEFQGRKEDARFAVT
jgi:hypothetical protein